MKSTRGLASLWKPLVQWRRQRRTPGRRGERAAAQFLRRHGYRILGGNLRLSLGEIDILAEAPDRRTIVLVEVKTREVAMLPADDALRPEVHVNSAKQRKLTHLALQLVKDRRLHDRLIRFDVIGVDLPRDGGDPVIRHHEGAFEAVR